MDVDIAPGEPRVNGWKRKEGRGSENVAHKLLRSGEITTGRALIIYSQRVSTASALIPAPALVLGVARVIGHLSARLRSISLVHPFFLLSLTRTRTNIMVVFGDCSCSVAPRCCLRRYSSCICLAVLFSSCPLPYSEPVLALPFVPRQAACVLPLPGRGNNLCFGVRSCACLLWRPLTRLL